MTNAGQDRRGESATSDDVVAELRTANRLLAVLATRGLEQRDAVLLLDAVGLQSRQIAAALGIKPTTVRVTLHRARKALRGRSDVDTSGPPEYGLTDGDE